MESASEDDIQRLLSFRPEDRAGSRHAAISMIVKRNWHAGKRWARYFVATLALPRVLAGTPDGGGQPASEVMTPYVDLPRLHDFQEELAGRIGALIARRRDGLRGILSLPTGAGKTRTAMESIVSAVRTGNSPPHLILWIAQSEELCEQAIQSLKEVWTSQTVRAASLKMPDPMDRVLTIHRLWESRDIPQVAGISIVVAGIQKLESLRKTHESELSGLFESVDVVVIDEAHHAIAPSYTRVFRLLGIERERASCAILGLTATPYRGSQAETDRLIGRFQGNLLVPPWENPVQELRRQQILAVTHPEVVDTRRSYPLTPAERKKVATFHELPVSVLNRIGQDTHRNRRILDRLLEIPESAPVLVFGCSVEHAGALALLLRRKGRTAASITADTPLAMRRA
ncbi:MAG: DEAD/DEAH box helicase family protein, partial [Candidatus Eremiobacterota bacterium]